MGNQRIIELLAATGMKRNDLAAVLGVDSSTLRRWSYGETKPPAKKLEALERLANGGKVEAATARVQPETDALAGFSTGALIEELARRHRGGIL